MASAFRPNIGLRRIISPSPPIPALDLAEVKAHLRIDFDDEDVLLRTLMDAATEYVESRGRALTTQTWEMVIDAFPYRAQYITLPINPVQSVESIKYLDSTGTVATWTSSEYVVSTSRDPARIALAYNYSWPQIRNQMDAVTIRFVAGYGDTAEQVPERAVQAMRLLIGHLYINREAVTVIQGIVSLELPQGLEALLDSIVVRGFR